jgi:hypothetical protein
MFVAALVRSRHIKSGQASNGGCDATLEEDSQPTATNLIPQMCCAVAGGADHSIEDPEVAKEEA